MAIQCNQMKTRDALEEISSVSLGNLKEPIDGDSSNLYQDARYEGDKFVGVALPAWVAVDWYRKLKAVKEKSETALSESARQCDVGTADEQVDRFIAYCCCKCDGSKCNHALNMEDEIYKCAIKWAQTPYEAERKGETDGR